MDNNKWLVTLLLCLFLGEFGIHRLQGKLDPGADISPQTQWKNGNLDPESEEAF